jgi:hypothetical protein
MKRLKLVFAGLALISLTACPEKPVTDEGNMEGADETSDNYESLIIEMDDGGGMLPIWYNVYISKDSAFWSYERYRHETKITWIPTDDELKKLSEDLHSNNFRKIESDCENEVYDRGGRSFSIKIGKENYKINNSGNCFIQEKWGENYKNINVSINNYVNKKIEAQMLKLPIKISPALLNAGYDITVRTNEEAEKFNVHPDTLSKDVRLYPGYNEFVVQLFYKDSTDRYGYPANYKYEQMFEEITNETKAVQLDWVNGNLDINVED